MAAQDQRRVDADIYVYEAIKVLHAVKSKRLAHTDATNIRAALEGLGMVQRWTAGAAVPDDARVAARLRQVAAAVKSCIEPDARIAHANIEAAAGIFQAMAARS
ncbi:MAG TPA: hypothetical protein VKP66_03445 [Steroidobacteraceae bacterium]|nr:hypothetical protein [Steroidobacteraceae bacterium]